MSNVLTSSAKRHSKRIILISAVSILALFLLPHMASGQPGRNWRQRNQQQRRSQRDAVEILQAQTEKLKALLDKELQRAFDPQSYQQLSAEQRDRLREEWSKARAERQRIIESIEQQLARLKGSRAISSEHDETIEKLKAIRDVARKEKADTTAECLAALIETREEAFRNLFVKLGFQTAPERTEPTEHRDRFKPGKLWPDDNGVHINAHGGGVLLHDGVYYWFGEHKTEGPGGNQANVGVHCYSSTDLYNWKDEGVALSVSADPTSDIIKGCVIERPKVIYCRKTGKFVMWFHLELKGQGYNAARTGVAAGDKVAGPYRYIRSLRPNAGIWPENFPADQRTGPAGEEGLQSWSDAWVKEVKNGLFVRRDFTGGQMSRDMTLFVDDDGKAYHIHASEENLTLHISELSDDYLSFSGRYIRVLPGGHNEAPALCKRKGKYVLLTSGCTGWTPNAARLAVADSIWGPWQRLDNPCAGLNPQNVMGPEKTFGGQSTFLLPVRGKQDAFIAMFDMWRPRNAIDGRYLWLPVQFVEDGIRIEWANEWDLSTFQDQPEESVGGYTLVWADEFNTDGPPDPCNWTYERGFVRNQELQWYHPDNARCENGLLIIEGRRQRVPNPNYSPGSRDWRRKNEYAEYTSACLKTMGRHQWMYGRFEMRGRIDTRPGLWPAFWTLGSARGWPGCGEIDIMEYYRGMLLANACWAGERRWASVWDDIRKPITDFDDKWSSRFHVWRMDWDPNTIQLYVDDELLNTVELSRTINGTSDKANPFHEPHYIILNLAVGGTNGGDPSQTDFPARLEVDYVRVSKK